MDSSPCPPNKPLLMETYQSKCHNGGSDTFDRFVICSVVKYRHNMSNATDVTPVTSLDELKHIPADHIIGIYYAIYGQYPKDPDGKCQGLEAIAYRHNIAGARGLLRSIGAAENAAEKTPALLAIAA